MDVLEWIVLRSASFFYVYIMKGSGYHMGIGERDNVYTLTKELCDNNQAIDNIKEKMKGNKDSIKAYDERNESIMDELRVRTEDDN